MKIGTIVLISATAQAQPEAIANGRDPAAIEILERADKAIRSLGTVSFRSEYSGAFSAHGRAVADVTLRRKTGVNDVTGTTRYSVRLDVTVADPPWGHEAYPPDYILVEDDGRTSLIDADGGTVKVADGVERMSLNGATTTLVLPQYLRPEPLGLELEQNIGAKFLGRTRIDGLECDIIWLRFEETNGFGEQLLFFGADDHLIRKAILMSPKTSLPGPADGPDITNPSVGFELVHRDLEILDRVPGGAFDVDDRGLHRIVLRAEEYGVGVPGPVWRLNRPGGGRVSSDDLSGQVAVLVFWASWCPTCHAFLPEVQRIHEAYGGKVRVLAINTFDRDDALGFIRENGYTFEVALGGDRLLEQFRFPGQPAVVVLDRDGTIRHRQLSAAPATTGNPAIWDAIDEALGDEYDDQTE